MGTIEKNTAAVVFSEKNFTVPVHCRSGNLGKTASSTLAGLGYTIVREFGEIRT